MKHRLKTRASKNDAGELFLDDCSQEDIESDALTAHHWQLELLALCTRVEKELTRHDRELFPELVAGRHSMCAMAMAIRGLIGFELSTEETQRIFGTYRESPDAS